MALPRGQVRTKVVVEGGAKAKKDVQEVRQAFDDLGDAGPSFADFAKTWTAVGAAMTAAAMAARELGRAIYQLGIHGGEVAAVANAFERIASPGLIGRLRTATGGMIRDFELMREATQALRAGLVSEDEIARWYSVVAIGAEQAGESVARTHEALGNMLAGGGFEEVLTKLGLSMSDIRTQVSQAGLSMESAAGQSLALDLALAEMEARVQGTEGATRRLDHEWATLSTTMHNSWDEFAEGFARGEALAGVFHGLNIEIGRGETSWESYGTTLNEVIAGALDSVLGLAQSFFELNLSIHDFIWNSSNAGQLLGVRSVREGTQLMIDYISGVRDRYGTRAAGPPSATDTEIEGLASTRGGGGGGPSYAVGGAPGRTPRPRSGAGGGGGNSGGSYEYFDLAGEMETKRKAQLGIQLEQEAAVREAQQQTRQELRDFWQEQDAHQLDRFFSRLDQEQRIHEFTMDTLAQQKEAEQQLADAREERIDKWMGTASQMAGGFQQIGQSIIGITEAMGASTEKQKKAEGALVIAYSSVMAALSLAESIRSFAKQDYAAGAAHLVAMASYIAAAAQAGSELGGGHGGGAKTGGSFIPARPEMVAPPSEGNEGTTIINQYSWGRSRGEAAEALADIEYTGERLGVSGAARGKSVWNR